MGTFVSKFVTMVRVVVKSRSGRQLGEYSATSVDELKASIHADHPKYYPSRQRLTVGPKGPEQLVLRDGDSMDAVESDAVVDMKDLGPQIGYRTVFLVEYGGPLLIHLFFYLYAAPLYRMLGFLGPDEAAPEMSLVQKAAAFCAVFHYAKRELETVFIHRFSNGTMPIFNIFRNSAHYWITGGIFIAFPIYNPAYAHDEYNPTVVYISIALFLIAQAGNFQSHVILRNLRAPGSRERKIPYGGAFTLVSCPNYFFEVMAWVAYTLLTQSICVLIFAIMGAGQMMQWADQKHRKYHKEFPNYPKNRTRMFPFVF